MSNKTKMRIALAEAIANKLWLQGLITREQRETVDKKSREILEKGDC